MITQEYLKSILNYDPNTGIFIWKISPAKSVKIGDIAGSPNNQNYIHISIKSKLYKAHRLAWLYMTGNWPNFEIDHKDLNRSNNRFDNLRECDHTKNLQNTNVYSNNLLGLKGVRKKKDKFEARIRVNKKLIYLGTYKNVEDAVNAYKNASIKYFNEFARM